MNDRDMYYNSYGYGGYLPLNNGTSGINIPIPPISTNSFASSQFNDINERISRLERQVKRLDQRLNRLETPYANTNKFNMNEPDNNMYMM